MATVTLMSRFGNPKLPTAPSAPPRRESSQYRLGYEAGYRAAKRTEAPLPAGRTRDPAKGEAVPRCLACGVPGSAKSRLFEFGLLLRGTPVGTVLLCEHDYYRQNRPDPQAGDPLRAEEAA